jgi:hypothetical protein
MTQNTKIKIADDVSFEQNFFQLAFAYVRDKVPNLLDYMLGFEVVDKNDEGTHAIGLFKFDVNGRNLYIPVFYKNGELKGADLLYNQNQDTFVPNKENWIDTILNVDPSELGGPSSMGRGDLMMGVNNNPDLSKIYNPTRNTKLSFDKMAAVPEHGQLSFLDFMKQADCRLAETYTNTLMRNPQLHKVAVEAYGEDLYEALKSCKQAENIVLDNFKVIQVEVIMSNSPSAVIEGLSENQKSELIQDGVVINDNRADGGRIPCKIQHPMILNAVASAGAYDLLMKGGAFLRTAAIPEIVHCDCAKYMLIPLESKDKYKPCCKETSKVMVSSFEEMDDEFDSFMNGLAEAGSARGVSYDSRSFDSKVPHSVFIEADGSMASPCLALETPVESEGTKQYCVKCGPGGICHVVVSPAYRRMKLIDDTLYVPSNAKVYSFNERQYFYADMPIGDHRDIDAKIKGLFDEVKVARDRNGYKVACNGQVIGSDLLKRDALVLMVTKLGMAVEPTRKAVNEASSYSSVKLALEKVAQPFNPGAVFTPTIPPTPMGMNAMLGVPEQYPQADMMGAQAGLPGNISNQRIMDSITGMSQSQPALPQESVDAIMQAAQSGDRDVFDVANISQMINKSDIDTPLEQYMSDLQLALDRLGRIYFLMLYHGDKFSERFSQEDLPSMEESLRTTFLGLGELILKLKERKIQSDSGSAVETSLNQLM